jgi:hypothetical protein
MSTSINFASASASASAFTKVKSRVEFDSISFENVETHKKGKDVAQPAFESQGHMTFYEGGAMTYYRRLRFGKVVGLYSPEEQKVKVSMKRFNGKTVKSVSITPTTITGWDKGTIRRGFKQLELIDPSCLLGKEDNQETVFLIEAEVNCVVNFFAAHLLKPWQRVEFPADGVDTVLKYPLKIPAHVFFPLTGGGIPLSASSLSYKLFKGETSIKEVCKKVLGSKGAAALKWLQSRINSWEYRAIECAAVMSSRGVSSEKIQTLNPKLLDRVGGADLEGICAFVGVNKALYYLEREDTFADIWMIGDTAQLIKSLPKEVALLAGETRIRHGLRYLHDVVSYVINHLSSETADLWQHPEYSKLDGVGVKGYTLRYPKTTTDLKSWGAQLSICIGAYDNAVHAGNSVCFALYKGNTPKYCVELSPKGGRYVLNQAKGFANDDMPAHLVETTKIVVKLDRKVIRNTNPLCYIKQNVDINILRALWKDALYHSDPKVLGRAQE